MSLLVLTLLELRPFLRVTGVSEDALITVLGEGVENWAQLFLGLAFEQSNEIQSVEGGGYSLRLPVRPVNTVTEIRDNVTSAVVAASSYTIYDNEIRLNSQDRWESGSFRYRATWNGGYLAANVPYGIKSAMMQLVARAYDNRGGKESEGAAGWNVGWKGLMTSDIRALLAPFRKGAML